MRRLLPYQQPVPGKYRPGISVRGLARDELAIQEDRADLLLVCQAAEVLERISVKDQQIRQLAFFD
jgi:hypothetical protein